MTNQLQDWPKRPWILALFLAVAGFAFYLVVEDKVFSAQSMQLRVALATFIAVTATSFAFTLERVRLSWVTVFSLVWGLVLAFVAHSAFIHPAASVDVSYAFFSGLLSGIIALPLFQVVHKYGALKLPYKDLHAAAWSDVICWCASWVFVGLSFALAYLLASLFDLIGIEFLKELLKKKWFTWVFIGASFGAALGVLKENHRIIASLQNLVMTVLSILAPILCVSLVLFLLALPFTGLQPFWDATRGTTPILLSCAIGAVVLINAIIRNTTEEESGKQLMRYSALGLALSVLPLTAIALVSMQQRVIQYGFTPDRIWGLLAVFVGVVYGLAYSLSVVWPLLKRRDNWPVNLRTNNLRIAIFLCVIALLLALPIVNFSKISVASQLARIEHDAIQADEIDYGAFAFDFGEEGRRALVHMQGSESELMANRAELALAADNRWSLKERIDEAQSELVVLSKLVVFPEQVAIPSKLEKAINKHGGCLGEYCVLIWNESDVAARSITSACSFYNWESEVYRGEGGYQHCPPSVTLLNQHEEEWLIKNRYSYPGASAKKNEKDADSLAISSAVLKGEIEVRTVELKQIFIGGKPVGQAY